MDKELDSNEWVYSYNQSDCLLSPWEISPSLFVSKSDRNQNKDCGSLVIPSSFFSSHITPQSVLSALGNLDFSTPFSDYRVADVEKFTTMFPDKEDQLDFSILSQFEKVIEECQIFLFNFVFSLFDVNRMEDMLKKEVVMRSLNLMFSSRIWKGWY